MFVDFFYTLRRVGIPVAPTAFLRLHRAMGLGLVASLDDFYVAARAILVKSERHFDAYDRVFAHCFQGAELASPGLAGLEDAVREMLHEWLREPKLLARALGLDEKTVRSMSPDELVRYFLDRLEDQDGEHHGGSRWIGTGGTSPVGHSGHFPGGMRVGGVSRGRSAVKVAMDRRYRDYTLEGPLTSAQLGEALKRLRHMTPSGPRDRINVERTVRETVRGAGEIEIVFDRGLADRLKVILAIDNGGWSMEPYVHVVQTLFSYARAQFKDLRTFYFHNTVYGQVWEDAPRMSKPFDVDDFCRLDPDTRFIAVGDASMSPYELMAWNGSIHFEERSGRPSIESLRLIAKTFRRCAWINPVPAWHWGYTQTIGAIAGVMPMFELTLDGLEQAVAHLSRLT